MNWTREDILSIPDHEKPSIRCRYPAVMIDEDGNREPTERTTTGRVIPDGNNPWVVIHVGGTTREYRVSWGLILEVLNDPYSAPIDGFLPPVEYEV